METGIDILNELKGLSSLLAGMEKLNVFTVPQGYFENLPGLMLMAVKDETGFLDHISRTTTATVPAGYFDGLADTILNRVKAQQNETAAAELRVLSPMLYSIQNENVFEVPAGYFDTLPEAIVEKIHPHQTKVIVMRKRSTAFMKYAVAAAFTGVMALGVFKFTAPADVKGGDAMTINIDKELDKVSNEDIIKYLEANGENVDATTVAGKTLDANDLPSQDDYINDDKALDKYLDNITANDLKN